MNIDMDGLEIDVLNDSIYITLDCRETSHIYSLAQIEELQGRLAIAAAKLRMKLAKEATHQ